MFLNTISLVAEHNVSKSIEILKFLYFDNKKNELLSIVIVDN